MPTTTLINWGSLALGSLGDDGLDWVTGLDGWEDLPPAVVNDVQRSNAHGSFFTPVWAGTRIVTATGFSLTDVARDAVFALVQRSLVMPGASPAGTLQITNVGRTLSAAAQLMSYAPVILNRGFWQAGHWPWVIQWRCTDPLRYGPTQTAGPVSMPGTSSGGLTFPLVPTIFNFGASTAPPVASLTNSGTADTPVLITVAAGASALTGGFQITEGVTGSILQYSDDLPANSSVVFDSSTGSVTLNGTADRRGSLTIAQWWQIPAGATRKVSFTGLAGTSATATLTASARPAYW